MQKGETEADNMLKNILQMKNPGDLLKTMFLVGVIAGHRGRTFFPRYPAKIFIQIFKIAWPGIIFTAFRFLRLPRQFMGLFPGWPWALSWVLCIGIAAVSIPAMLGHFIYNSTSVVAHLF